jgi:PilZ domain
MSQTQELFDTTSDRRRFSRSSVLWEAAILEGDRADGCVLLNISEGGALLRVLDPFACPTTLNLEIARVGKLDARVAWRGADSVGVLFKGDPHEIAERFKQAALARFAS